MNAEWPGKILNMIAAGIDEFKKRWRDALLKGSTMAEP